MRIQISRRLCERHIRFEPAERGESRMIPAIQVILVRAQIVQRNVNLRFSRQLNVRRNHADDLALHTVERDGLADDVMRTAEAAFP